MFKVKREFLVPLSFGLKLIFMKTFHESDRGKNLIPKLNSSRPSAAMCRAVRISSSSVCSAAPPAAGRQLLLSGCRAAPAVTGPWLWSGGRPPWAGSPPRSPHSSPPHSSPPNFHSFKEKPPWFSPTSISRAICFASAILSFEAQ